MPPARFECLGSNQAKEGYSMPKNSKASGTGQRNRAKVQRRSSRRLFDDVLALAAAIGSRRQESAAGNLLSLATATRSFRTALTDMPNLRAQAAAAGDRLEGLVEYAVHTDIEQLVKDMGTFTRRHPVAALAIAAATALVVSRFRRQATSNNRPARRPTAVIARKLATPRRKGTNGQAHASA
jgi:hypothetical protein